MNIKQNILILVLGLILRLLLAATAYHPDVGIIDYSSAVLLKEGRFDIYDFNSTLGWNDPRKDVYSQQVPDDLPLQYWLRLPIEIFTRPLINQQVEAQFLTNINPLLGNFDLQIHLLLVKLPLLIFDLLLGIILSLLFPLHLRSKAMLFWMVNPMTLWATAAIGQVDVMPTLFMVLAFLLLQKGKPELSILSLGTGVALKSFPLLIAPFFILKAENWSKRIVLTGLLFIPLVLTILPYLGSQGFRNQALYAPQLDKMLYAKIPLSGGEGVYITVAILLFLYLLYQSSKKSFEGLLSYSNVALLLVLAFTHFHIQWFLWLTPFLIFYLLKGLEQSQKISLYLLLASLVLMLFLFESSLQVRLFAPLFPALGSGQGLAESLDQQKLSMLKDIASSVFAATAIYFSLNMIKKTPLG